MISQAVFWQVLTPAAAFFCLRARMLSHFGEQHRSRNCARSWRNRSETHAAPSAGAVERVEGREARVISLTSSSPATAPHAVWKFLQAEQEGFQVPSPLLLMRAVIIAVTPGGWAYFSISHLQALAPAYEFLTFWTSRLSCDFSSSRVFATCLRGIGAKRKSTAIE